MDKASRELAIALGAMIAMVMEDTVPIALSLGRQSDEDIKDRITSIGGAIEKASRLAAALQTITE